MNNLRITFFLCAAIALVACANKKALTTQTEKATEVTPTIKQETKDTAFKIKIIRTSCASLVGIIMDDSFKKYGEEWAPYNVRMAKPYEAAVNIANKCAVPDKVKEGSIIKVALLNKAVADKNPCIVCMMMDYPPKATINVKFLENLGEEQ